MVIIQSRGLLNPLKPPVAPPMDQVTTSDQGHTAVVYVMFAGAGGGFYHVCEGFYHVCARVRQFVQRHAAIS